MKQGEPESGSPCRASVSLNRWFQLVLVGTGAAQVGAAQVLSTQGAAQV